MYDLAGLVLDRESPLVVGHPGRQLEHPVLAAVLVPDGRHANLGLALRHHVRVPDVFVVVDARVHHGRLGAALHARGVQGELGGVVLVVHDGEGDEEDDGDDDRGGDRDGDVDPDAPLFARGELVLLLAAGDARDRVALLRVDVAGRAETRAAPLAEQPLGLVTRHDARSGYSPRAPVTSVPAEVDETSEKNEWRFALRGRWRCSTGDPPGPPRPCALGYLDGIARSATRGACAVREPASRVTLRALRRTRWRGRCRRDDRGVIGFCNIPPHSTPGSIDRTRPVKIDRPFLGEL